MSQKLKEFIESLDYSIKSYESVIEKAKKKGDIPTQIAFENRLFSYTEIRLELAKIYKESLELERMRFISMNALYGKTPDLKPVAIIPECNQPFICLKGMRGSGKRYTLFEENLKRLIREVLMENDQNDK